MSLTALPPEILCCILAKIASQPTLCNLARCSRQLYLCTLPHLYRRVSIQERFWQGKWQIGKLRNLASLLIQRPDIAVLVRQFTLQVEAFQMPRVEWDQDSRERHDRIFVILAGASRLSREEKINCLDQFGPFHPAHHDLLLALLLPALLKVEELVLELNLKIHYQSSYLEEMMRKAARRERPFDIQPPFEALTLFAQPHNSVDALSTRFIASLLKLPAIRTISGSFRNMWSDTRRENDSIIETDDDSISGTDRNLKKLDSSSSPLTSLDLKDCRLSKADLGHILRAPKALKTLTYKLSPCEFVKLTDLRDALKPQEMCLESLCLDLKYDEDGDSDLFGLMISFSSLRALKVFKTPAGLLVERNHLAKRDNLINIFPPNIETLHLTHFQASFESLLEALEYLLAQKSHQIPSLRSLIVEESYSDHARFRMRFGARPVKLMEVLWRDTHEIAMERLGRVAAAQGISLDVTEASIEQVEGAWLESEQALLESEQALFESEQASPGSEQASFGSEQDLDE